MEILWSLSTLSGQISFKAKMKPQQLIFVSQSSKLLLCVPITLLRLSGRHKKKRVLDKYIIYISRRDPLNLSYELPKSNVSNNCKSEHIFMLDKDSAQYSCRHQDCMRKYRPLNGDDNSSLAKKVKSNTCKDPFLYENVNAVFLLFIFERLLCQKTKWY